MSVSRLPPIPPRYPRPVTGRETLTVLRNMVLVLLDSERSQEIIESEDILCRKQFARLGHQLRRCDAGRTLLEQRPELDTDVDALAKFPDGTLGREYARHLQTCELGYSLDAMPFVQQQIQYVVQGCVINI